VRLPVEYYIGLKYLLAKRKQTFISIITVISVAGVTVGVMALIIVLAVMSGFEKELKNRILGATAHVQVISLDGSIGDPFPLAARIRGVQGVAAASPYVFSQVMISSGTAASGGVLRGVDPATAGQVTRLAQDIRIGSLADLTKKGPGGMAATILGKELASHLGVSVGDVIEIMVPGGNVTPLGAFPRVVRYVVAGLAESGMYEFDSTFAYVSFDEAGRLMGMAGRATGIEVRVHDIYAAGDVAARIRTTLGYPYWAKDWAQTNRNLFSALKLEKTVMFIILVLIVFVAAFNIISTLIMVVTDKTREIGILRAMGMRAKSIRRVFFAQGLVIGVVGTVAGLVLGLAVSELIGAKRLIRLDPAVYFIDHLPVSTQVFDVTLIVLASLGVAAAATLYPARQAARLYPVEAIRHE